MTRWLLFCALGMGCRSEDKSDPGNANETRGDDTSDTDTPSPEDTADSGDPPETTDTGDTGDTGTAPIPPTCEITDPVGEDLVFGTDETVSFTAIVADPDGSPELLEVLWSSDAMGPLGSATPDADGNAHLETDGLIPAAHLVSISVTDPQGLNCTDEVALIVSTPPTILITDDLGIEVTDPVGLTVDLGTLFEVQAHVDDAEDLPELLTVDWFSDVADLVHTGTADTEGISRFTADDTFPAGTHLMTITVTDSVGLTGTTVFTLQVNSPPDAPEINISPDAPRTTDDLRASISSDGEDPDGDELSYAYSWSKADTTDVFETADLAATHTSKGEEWTVTVTPSDGRIDGEPATASVTVLNSPPVVETVSVMPSSPLISDILTCEVGTTTDADEDTVDLHYEWIVEGSTVESDSPVLTAGFSSGNAVQCRVLPNDGEEDGEAVTSDPVVIDNSAPSIARVTLSPDTIRAGEALTCSWDGYSDPDGDPDWSTLEWDINGEPAGTGSTLSAGFGRADLVTCTVTPFDGHLSGEPRAASITVSNSPPSISTVFIDPDPARVGDTLSCSAGGFFDADGDLDHSTLTWKVNGDVVGAESTLSDGFSGGDTVTCEVTPADGLHTGDTVSAEITIANSAPSVASVSISPAEPTASSSLSCSYTDFVDPDGDPDHSTLTWRVAGEDAGTEPTLSGAFAGGQTVECIVTPNDGTDAGTPVSATVVIDNTPPSLESVTITPTAFRAGTPLTCTAGPTSDPDGDAVTVELQWFINLAPVGEGPSLTSDFVAGDEVSCTGTPSDGTQTGESKTDRVTVDNSPPSVASVTISPEAPRFGDTITCAYTGFSDADGDPDHSTYAWTVDIDDAPAGPTLDASPTKGQAVVCTVTPNDGHEDGEPVSSTVTIANTPPEIITASILPEYPRTNDVLSVISTVTDADGDDITFSILWTGSSMMGSVESPTLDGTTEFEKADVVTATVTAHDGDDSSVEYSSATFIVNTPPTAPGVSIIDREEALKHSISFGGSGRVQIGSHGLPTDDSPRSFAIWFKSSCSWVNGNLFSYGNAAHSTTRERFSLFTNWSGAGGGCNIHFAGQGYDFFHGTPYSGDRWQHAVLTYDGSTLKMYIQGTEVASTSGVTLETASGTDLNIGMDTSDRHDEFYQGRIAQLKAWNRALSSGEVAAEFDGTTVSSGLIARWDLDEGTGSSTSEALGMGWDGTLHGLGWSDEVPDVSIPTGLVCSIDEESTDADADEITYSLAWEVDGEAFTDTETTIEGGDTVSNDALGFGETWTCTVTPNDSEDVGDAGSDSHETTACYGSSEGCPGTSCNAILDAGASTGDGAYWIDPAGTGAFQAYCDMTDDGGGWTLIAIVHPARAMDLSEPVGWFGTERYTGPLSTFTLDSSGGLSSFGTEVFNDYVRDEDPLSRFTIHADLDHDFTYSWFKDVVPESFSQWFANDTTDTLVCHDVDMTDTCGWGIIKYTRDVTSLGVMTLPPSMGGSGPIHMRLDGDTAAHHSAICSSTGDHPGWPDSYGGHWGNGLSIWLQ